MKAITTDNMVGQRIVAARIERAAGSSRMYALALKLENGLSFSIMARDGDGYECWLEEYPFETSTPCQDG